MRLSRIRVQNYRGLKDASIPLSEFACLIGRNNSGKSSFLQCISLLNSGTKLKTTDYYDESKPIRIEITLEGIEEADLARVTAEEHRKRFSELIHDGQLRLVRLYEPEAGKSTLMVVRMMPKDPKFNLADLMALMKGKKGAALREAVVEKIAELDSKLEAAPTQGAVIAALEEIVGELNVEDLHESDEALTTGLPQSIIPLLPEVVYIPAVKDVTDEIKTTESATFGKLLHILFDQIEDQFEDLEQQFADLQKKLSRVVVDDKVTDNRLPQVRLIEETIQRFVQHNFPDVELKLEVPAPELRTILSTAEINVDDGYEGPITSKGDGLKRAVAFAVLQAYAELKGDASTQSGEAPKERHPYILLFEEPELYLHPGAQAQLFSALETFSKDQTVIVTTHNPVFFNADSTKTFVKLSKVSSQDDSPPITKSYPIDLTDMTARDQMQLIGYENNNAALFYDRVVLIEGDSDYIVFPHVAKLTMSAERLAKAGVAFVRISGKGSLRRYREFFDRCGIVVQSISDLDVITNQFDKLDPSEEAKRIRTELLEKLDGLEDDGGSVASSSSVRDVARGNATRALWEACREAQSAWKEDPSDENSENLAEAMKQLQDRVDAPARYVNLRSASKESEVGVLRQQLIDELRKDGTHVLIEGCLEDYFPDQLNASDKVEGALSLCAEHATAESLAAVTQFGEELELILNGCADKELPAS